MPSPGPSHPLAPPQASLPIPGLDQDWSAIAATQCRLDKEGATKLVCDLITSTKNEKIFQESIGLAIRLLDGGNTEIQVRGGRVWGARGSPPFGGESHSGGGQCAQLLIYGVLAAGLSTCGQLSTHICPCVTWPLFYLRTLFSAPARPEPAPLPSCPPLYPPFLPQPLPGPLSHLSHILLSLWCPARGLPPPESPLGLLYLQ